MLVACPAIFAGPISTYYLTAGDQTTNWIIQGDTAQSSSQQYYQEYAIAVSGGQVRTLGGNGGALYDLSFVYQGVDYTGPDYTFYDGTSDGTYNYAVNYFSGEVYRTNLDWSNPAPLFNTGFGGYDAIGITWDSLNNSLWVSQWDGSHIYDFTLAGAVLSSFDAGHSRITSLAMDPADHTLWFGNQGSMGTFEQFSTTGTLLQTQFYENMSGQNTLGGEFGGVPEPASGFLLGCGLAGLAMLRRRQR
jgi:hypothetical protein